MFKPFALIEESTEVVGIRNLSESRGRTGPLGRDRAFPNVGRCFRAEGNVSIIRFSSASHFPHVELEAQRQRGDNGRRGHKPGALQSCPGVFLWAAGAANGWSKRMASD